MRPSRSPARRHPAIRPCSLRHNRIGNRPRGPSAPCPPLRPSALPRDRLPLLRLLLPSALLWVRFLLLRLLPPSALLWVRLPLPRLPLPRVLPWDRLLSPRRLLRDPLAHTWIRKIRRRELQARLLTFRPRLRHRLARRRPRRVHRTTRPPGHPENLGISRGWSTARHRRSGEWSPEHLRAQYLSTSPRRIRRPVLRRVTRYRARRQPM